MSARIIETPPVPYEGQAHSASSFAQPVPKKLDLQKESLAGINDSEPQEKPRVQGVSVKLSPG